MIVDNLTEENARVVSEEVIKRLPSYSGGFEGRGIVICAGGVKLFTNAWVCINMLRQLQCVLPIQIWYLGKKELDDQMKSLVRPLNVECIDAVQLKEKYPARILNGWEVKPYSIIHSPFKEVLLLDADNVPIVNPEFLFESPQFKETGAIFWPDYHRLEPSRSIWDICGVEYRDEPEFETGQILIDKERCWKPLLLSMWYNEYSDFYYHHIHGDKETFHMAFRKLKKSYSMPDTPIYSLSGVMCQHDFKGRKIFQHRNLVKWSFHGDNQSVEGFIYEEECRGFLQDLRKKWDGRINVSRFDISTKSEKEKLFSETIINSVFDYHRVGHDRRPMGFLPDGTIGLGADGQEVFWDLRKEEKEMYLEIFSENDITCRLKMDEKGVWRGRWINFEKMPVELSPVSSGINFSDKHINGHIPLEEFARKVIIEAEPMSQNTNENNLGFGWIYYSFIRNLQPNFIVAIGSCRGFMPFCAARAVQDNGFGKVIFIDPSYEGNGHPGWGGKNLWVNPEEVNERIASFGLTGWITHLRMTSEEAFPHMRKMLGDKSLGMVIIDGAHSYENSLQDFELYSSLMNSGMIMFHDSVNPNCEVARTLHALRTRGHSIITIDVDAGLSILEISRPPRVEDKWDYLVRPSNRGKKILTHLEKFLQPGDNLFDAYCGFSPLAALVRDVKIFGFDIDHLIIQKLRKKFPEHCWMQIEERYLPYADIPEKCDILISLGLNYGYSSWDAQLVELNIKFLLRFYHPRVCLFEAAANYHNAEILDGLQRVLLNLGYSCQFEYIETDLENYSDRKLLMAQRKFQH